jgi:hypothetical protein
MLRINMYICNYSSLLAVAPCDNVSPGVSLSPMNNLCTLVQYVLCILVLHSLCINAVFFLLTYTTFSVYTRMRCCLAHSYYMLHVHII